MLLEIDVLQALISVFAGDTACDLPMYSEPRATLKYIGIGVKIVITVHGIAVH